MGCARERVGGDRISLREEEAQCETELPTCCIEPGDCRGHCIQVLKRGVAARRRSKRPNTNSKVPYSISLIVLIGRREYRVYGTVRRNRGRQIALRYGFAGDEPLALELLACVKMRYRSIRP